MNVLPYILATAGHVDHGKSALVHALTGTDPDRLPEEKSRGMTIDLGFAHLRLPSPIDPSTQYEIGIVDVPGHEDFVKNMVAGVGSIDAALLVVAADDGWMPQTEEHLQILEYLGVRRGIVALSKIDLTSNQQDAIDRVRQHLAHGPFADVPIIPVSTKTAHGLDNLKSQLSKLCAELKPQADSGKPRLSVDRVFAVKGAGTVVTGTLCGGSFNVGQPVTIQPQATSARIRGLQSYHHRVDIASPGSRVAVNLADVNPSSLARGDVVCLVDSFESATTFDVLLHRSQRCASPWNIKRGAHAWLHHATAAIPARVFPVENAPLLPGGEMLARLILDAPLCATIADRFVIRDWSGQHTLAGGIILDLAPPRLGRANAAVHPSQLQLLTDRARDADDLPNLIMTQLARDGVCDLKPLQRRGRQSVEALSAALASLQQTGKLLRFDRLICLREFWDRLHDVIRRKILDFHAQHPERPGPPLSEIHAFLETQMCAQARSVAGSIARHMTQSLCENGFEQAGPCIRSRAHRLSLPPRLQSAGERIRRLLHERGLDAPSIRELAPDDLSHQAIKFLIAQQEAVQIGPDLVISATSYQIAAQTIRAFIQSHGPATVSELKAHLNSTRRVMIPLLEKLDRDRITRREADRRMLARTPEVSAESRR